MNIRNATYRDAPTIRLLLEALGYKTSISLVISQVENVFGLKEHQVFVYELDKEVVGFISVHFLPQLGFERSNMVISYLSVESGAKLTDIKSELVAYVTELAQDKKCQNIQVYCADWRSPEQQFYKQQGYIEYAHCYTKRLV